MNRALTALAAMLAMTSLASAQESRAQITSNNNAAITPNGRGAVTGSVLNNILSQIITGMGAVNDVNTWTGVNTFSGTIISGGVTTIQAPSDSASDMSGVINSALSRVSKVQLTCGVFALNKSILVPSNSELSGSGPCTQIVTTSISANAPWASLGASNVFVAITNSDFANGNSSISIHDLSIDLGSGSNGGTVSGIEFFKGSTVSVQNINITSAINNGNDGIAFIQSDHYTNANNKVSGATNACFDQWWGSHDFVVSGNTCDGGGIVSNGVLANGLGSAFAGSPVATTYNGVISGNKLNAIKNAAIYVGGLSAAGNTGSVNKISVVSNIVNGVTNFHGIYLLDGTNLSAVGNIIENVGGTGIYAYSTTGVMATVSINDNIISSVNLAAHSSSAIDIGGPSTTGVFTANNLVVGSTQLWAIHVASGPVGTSINEKDLPTGTSNGNSTLAIQDNGTNSTIMHTVTGVAYVNGAALAFSSTGSWTPTLRFGGVTTGITYSAQAGQYWKTGSVVYACGQISLSSKGASTGQATIAGLPFAANAAGGAFKTDKLTGSSGLSSPNILVTPNVGTTLILYTDPSLSTTLQDTNFTDTTSLNSCGSYATP